MLPNGSITLNDLGYIVQPNFESYKASNLEYYIKNILNELITKAFAHKRRIPSLNAVFFEAGDYNREFIKAIAKTENYTPVVLKTDLQQVWSDNNNDPKHIFPQISEHNLSFEEKLFWLLVENEKLPFTPDNTVILSYIQDAIPFESRIYRFNLLDLETFKPKTYEIHAGNLSLDDITYKPSYGFLDSIIHTNVERLWNAVGTRLLPVVKNEITLPHKGMFINAETLVNLHATMVQLGQNYEITNMTFPMITLNEI